MNFMGHFLKLLFTLVSYDSMKKLLRRGPEYILLTWYKWARIPHVIVLTTFVSDECLQKINICRKEEVLHVFLTQKNMMFTK